MEKFVIEGGKRLKGTVSISGNKNEALPAIAACLLTDETVILKNVPRIRDVETMLYLIKDLGAEVREITRNELAITCNNIENKELDPEKCADLRASILLAGPLLARFGSVKLPPPGGDVIGRRRLDTHFLSFRKMGAKVTVNQNYVLHSSGLQGTRLFLDEASVTATENIITAASLAKGITFLQNAACEPHVANLTKMLISMGAKISGRGTHLLEIQGTDRLSGTEHTIGSDYLEVGSFISLAAVTNSDLWLENVNTDDLIVTESTFRKLGIKFEYHQNKIHVPSDQKLEIVPDLSGAIPKIDDGPWPMFPTDMMSIAIVTATQAKGTILLFEKMYDGRMFFVDHLMSMGAQIVLCDPHRVVVVGPSQLFGTRVQSPDIRAGMALIIAALCARGITTIYNIKQIDRGYENLEIKLQKLGANIRRIQE